MKKVQVLAGARLHFGLIDLSGMTKHSDGGIGLSIQKPNIEVIIENAEKLNIEVPPNYKFRFQKVIKSLHNYIKLKNLKVIVKTDIEPHTGFGSGTQFSLALGTALLNFFGMSSIPYTKLSCMLGRGGTSGIGTHSFKFGGLLVDGGRYWPYKKPKFGPSSAYSFSTAPPLIARLPFPEWGICIVLPQNNLRVSGNLECSFFEKLCPITINEVKNLCSLVILHLLPAVATKNFALFCNSIEDLRNQGFKKREVELAGEKVQRCISLLESVGFKGVSMSAWGPAIFGFTSSLKKAKELACSLKDNLHIKKIIITKAQNEGVQIKRWI